MDWFTRQMEIRSERQNPEEWRAGSRNHGSPGPLGHGLPWKDRDPDHTRAPQSGIKMNTASGLITGRPTANGEVQ